MKKRKILISYFFKSDSIQLGFAFRDALTDMDYEVATFHSQTEHPLWPFIKHINKILKIILSKPVDVTSGTSWSNHNYREKKLKELVDNYKPNIILVIRGNSFSGKTLKSIKSRYPSIKTVGWWVKDPRKDDEMVEDSKLYDYYLSMHDYGYTSKDNIKHLPVLGVYKNLYMCIQDRTESNLTKQICFVGGYVPRREVFIRELEGFQLEIYGPGWKKGKRAFNFNLMAMLKGSSIWGKQLVDLYNSSEIVLNISSWDSDNLGGQNLRLFDVPACGAFLLTEYSEELSEHYRLGVEIETFKTPDELRDKVDYYLKHPVERERIAKLGYERVLKLPNYETRMKEMIKFIEL